MVTRQGLPVGYEVLPGACFEGHSLPPVIEKMRQSYKLQRAVCVAERGMLNEANLQAPSGAYKRAPRQLND